MGLLDIILSSRWCIMGIHSVYLDNWIPPSWWGPIRRDEEEEYILFRWKAGSSDSPKRMDTKQWLPLALCYHIMRNGFLFQVRICNIFSVKTSSRQSMIHIFSLLTSNLETEKQPTTDCDQEWIREGREYPTPAYKLQKHSELPSIPACLAQELDKALS